MDMTKDGTFTEPEAPATRRRPIVRRSLHDEVVETLRDMIVEGELAPGSHLNEQELCRRFAISRTPLREAFKVLASEDLVVLLPYRGARVAALTPEEVEEVFQVIGALEALAGELACRRMTDAEVAEIRALHGRMVGHYEAGERSDYFKLNQRIHERLMAAAGNATLAKVYRGLSGRVRAYRYRANLSEDRWREAVAEHDAMLAALEARDAPRLAAILAAHLRRKAEAVKAAVAADAARREG